MKYGRISKLFFLSFLSLMLVGCSASEETAEIVSVKNVPIEGEVAQNPVEETGNSLETFTLEARGDNWFAVYDADELIVEDSVSITTERSFNAETASFEGSYPLRLNVIMKDFKENDTGLEYIGDRNQQMGDGGFIMQIKDAAGDVVAVTNDTWSCLSLHQAPLDKSCETESDPQVGVSPCDFNEIPEPSDWKSQGFDISSRPSATVHSASSVSPKDGYDTITRDSRALFIRGPDLETDNTVICSLIVETP